MATYSVDWSARLASTSGSVAVGHCLVVDSLGYHYVGTTANRATYGRCIGIASTAGDANTPVVSMIEAGPVPASITGLAAGTASWVRVSSSGTLERVTPGSGDDIIGKAHADGSVQLHPGVWDSANYAGGGGGGGSFTAGGDLTGDATTQTVAKVNGTTITSAGGALAVGAVLRTTAVGTADWGAVDLADTDAVTGVLPKVNQGAQDMGGDVTGTTAASVVAKVNGIAASGTPAIGNTLGATSTSACVWSALNLAGGANYVTGTLPVGNGGTGITSLGAGVATMLGTFSSANIATACTDETGTGSLVFGTAPLFKTTINLNNPGNTFKYVITPAAIAADRTLTLPLLAGADTMVCEAFAQTLTNKTIVAASNTITDTSAATGDILRHNGTRFVRLARGSANQVLTTNAGATDISWATPTAFTAPTGTGVMTVTGGAMDAASTATTGSGNFVRATGPTVSAPTLTGVSTISAIRLTGVTANSATATTLNDLSLGGNRKIRFTGASGPTLTGLDATGIADGDIVVLIATNGTVVCNSEDAGSSAANRFSLRSARSLQAPGAYLVMYDGTLTRWIMMGADYTQP